MQRSELRKAIKSYASRVNFHKYGLIRQLIKLKEKRWDYLKSELKKREVVCPFCGEEVMCVEYSDSEYDDSVWLDCCYCGESLDDSDDRVIAYMSIHDRLHCEAYFDSLENVVIFGDSMGGGYKWEQYCEQVIRGLLEKGLGD